MVPLVKPVITHEVAGNTTEQVFAGERATPELLKAVTSIDVVGPTVVPDAAAGVAAGVLRMRQQSSSISADDADSSLAIPATKSVSRPRAQARIGGR